MKHLTSLMSIQKSIVELSHIPVQISNHSNCPYIDNKIETRAFVNLSEHPETHDQLAETGFRRVENWAYKPICSDCNELIYVRLIILSIHSLARKSAILFPSDTECPLTQNQLIFFEKSINQ